MLSRSRLYTKKEPDKEAKLFIIFCEGEKTEPNYFKYFNGIASQIRIELVAHVDGKNSPLGLYETAGNLILPSPENPFPKYALEAEDEIWFIVDTDNWGNALPRLRRDIGKHKNWSLAQSNPCFEVWLNYHFESDRPALTQMEIANSWKQYLNQKMGGFNATKHPVLIETAIVNARENYAEKDGMPELACTEVYRLAEKILPLVKSEIDAALQSLNAR
jgi:hypothetical protein